MNPIKEGNYKLQNGKTYHIEFYKTNNEKKKYKAVVTKNGEKKTI